MGGHASHNQFTASVGTDLLATGDHLASAALAYARAGLAVFPVFPVADDGRCACGRDCGRDAGKHPIGSLAARGLLDATVDSAAVAQWWALWPDANVGIRTGAPAGVWVLDVDTGTGGDVALDALEAENGGLPPTWAVETGGGGLHLWWRQNVATVPTRAGRIGAGGLDVRGDGGYVVAPPSRHRSGARYRWAAAWSPQAVPLAEPPPWLLALAAEPAGPTNRGGDRNQAALADPVVAGARNATLTSWAGTMRRRGFGESAIRAALLAENAERCAPPLDAAEVEKIARSVARYAPDHVPSPGFWGKGRRGRSVVFVDGKAVAR